MGEIFGDVSRTDMNYSVTLGVDSDFDRKTIWKAITREEALSTWLGKPSDRIQTGKTFTVTYPNEAEYSIRATVRERRVPSTLLMDWQFNELPTNTVRISLSKRNGGGTEVRLTVSGLRRDDVAWAAATWHTQMEFLRNYLLGHEVIGHALRFRRDELVPNYERQVRELGGPRSLRRKVSRPAVQTKPAEPNGVRQVMHQHAYLA